VTGPTSGAAAPELPADPSPDGDERTLALWFLDYYRVVFERKVTGLDDVQARATTCPPSELTALGLVRHMADVERGWFRRSLGERLDYLFDYSADEDVDFHPDAADTLADALRRWRAEVEGARSNLAAASFDDLITRERPESTNWSVRWVVLHMIEEYARHAGHLDLITEAIDGRKGD